MNQSPPTLSTEEQEQILQTIEMFEVIVQANPHDCQSMEILKDAYQRMGRKDDTIKISKKLAEVYTELGQFSAALLEYEGILQKDADNPEIIAALGEVEEKMQKAGQQRAGAQPAASGAINLDFRAAVADTGTLMTTSQTTRPEGARSAAGSARVEDIVGSLKDDGNEALAKFLIQHRLVNEEVVASALERVQKRNRELTTNSFATSLIDEIVRRGAGDRDALLCGILDRSKFAFIPLEYYDVDRQVVKMLPEALTLGRLMVPFDVISRTIMIATANPFDALGKEAVQQLLDYNIQWHLAAPTAIIKVLSETYRISAPGTGDKSSGGVQFAESNSIRLA